MGINVKRMEDRHGIGMVFDISCGDSTFVDAFTGFVLHNTDG